MKLKLLRGGRQASNLAAIVELVHIAERINPAVDTAGDVLMHVRQRIQQLRGGRHPVFHPAARTDTSQLISDLTTALDAVHLAADCCDQMSTPCDSNQVMAFLDAARRRAASQGGDVR